nr:putative ribonuclease H-like domain-containing protein [Tanacetum cinerariifolium]
MIEAVKKIFKYLKGQPKLGLWYPRESPFVLEAYSDSDYAGANKDRKSTTSGCQFLGRRLISWQCKKQTIVATSSTEVEYVDAANCCGQIYVYGSWEDVVWCAEICGCGAHPTAATINSPTVRGLAAFWQLADSIRRKRQLSSKKAANPTIIIAAKPTESHCPPVTMANTTTSDPAKAIAAATTNLKVCSESHAPVQVESAEQKQPAVGDEEGHVVMMVMSWLLWGDDGDE